MSDPGKRPALAILPALVMAIGISHAATYSVPSSIDPTGGRDVTDELKAFIASVPNGTSSNAPSIISFAPAANYWVEGTLYIYGRSNLVFDGNGARFFARTNGTTVSPPPEPTAQWLRFLWPRHRAHWLFDTCRGIAVSNVVVSGGHTNAGAFNASYVASLEAQHGFEIAATTNALLDSCTVSNTFGDLISITRRSRNVTVQNCRVERCGRQGMTVDNGQDVLLRKNSVAEIGRSAFDLEPAVSNWQVLRVTIQSNLVGRANGVFVAALGAGRDVSDIVVEGNHLTNFNMQISVAASDNARRRNWKILNNTTTNSGFGSPIAPIRFTRVDNILVEGNYQRIATTQSRLAVFFRECCNFVVRGNQFPGALNEFDSDGFICPRFDGISVLLGDDLVRLRLIGMPGRTGLVERSIDLRTWIPVQTNVFSDEPWEWVDSTPSSASRFYRALQQR